jgi:hypothetical protein
MVKLALLDYELRREKFIKKSITDTDCEVKRMPLCQEIDELKREESQVLSEINYLQSELWHMFCDDY